MDMDYKSVVETVQAFARSLGAELSSPWFYLQFGLILAGAGIGLATNAAIRARVDMDKLATRWPLPFRHFARVLVERGHGPSKELSNACNCILIVAMIGRQPIL